jgi:multicomponent Na+:H+ antiporter subunit F
MTPAMLTLGADAASTPARAELLLLPYSSTMLAWVFSIGLIGLGLAMILATSRVVAGPSVPDRVVSLDVIANLSVAGIAVFAMASGLAGLLVVAIVVALILFLGTTAYALYLERRARP